mmetsp:Transcript_15759/g.32364  ORF Transcript_15759/g.32364 Transcript_15759/m.32364 type:complete len:87 (-) Transcript_15759:1318-1578(-)
MLTLTIMLDKISALPPTGNQYQKSFLNNLTSKYKAWSAPMKAKTQFLPTIPSSTIVMHLIINIEEVIKSIETNTQSLFQASAGTKP